MGAIHFKYVYIYFGEFVIVEPSECTILRISREHALWNVKKKICSQSYPLEGDLTYKRVGGLLTFASGSLPAEAQSWGAEHSRALSPPCAPAQGKRSQHRVVNPPLSVGISLPAEHTRADRIIHASAPSFTVARPSVDRPTGVRLLKTGGQTRLILRLLGRPLLLPNFPTAGILLSIYLTISLSQFSNSIEEEKWVSFKFSTRKIPYQENCQKFEQKQGHSTL